MGRRKADMSSLFDALAEALVLVDHEDETTCVELLALVRQLADAADAAGVSQHVEPIIFAAEGLCQGDTSMLVELERSYDAARKAIVTGQGPATGTPKQKPSRRSTATKEVAAPMPLAGDAELLKDFGVRAGEHLDDADEYLLALEADPNDRDAVDAVFRAFHTIKGMAGFLSLDAISTLSHESESLLAAARTDGSAIAAKDLRALFVAVDKMRILVADASGVAVARAGASEAQDSAAPGDDDRRSGQDRRESERREVERRAGETRAKASRGGTLRVDGDKLDGLLDAIGELVIAESMVSAEVRNGGDAVQLAGKLDQLDKITRELQQMATSLRMVPLRAVFRRMARLVHDVADKAGKQVDFVTVGEDTELDKTVVDRIEDPLVHALRNAIDHGIEPADERRAAGKPEAGRIELRAFHAGGAIHIEVSDDGRGIDGAAVGHRAAAAGILDHEAALEGRPLLDVLCRAGFSTADVVSDVSGRGVGMDVVRRTVEELRGRLDVKSECGAGTTFSIRLPVTLAIIDGMVLRVGDERFVLPLLAIERSVRPLPGDVATVAGRQEMLAVGGQQLLPILRLHRLFDADGAQTDPTQGVVVIVSDNGVRAGLLACELLGQQQTVIKPLGDGLPDMPGIAGGAVMPDGRVGLILDAAGLVRSAHDKGGE